MEQSTICIDPREVHGRDAYRLASSIVVPRPIAWVSTVGLNGSVNLAPFSFFNLVASRPPVIAVSFSPRAGVEKHTLRNCRETGEFVVNVVDNDLAEAMNLTSKNCEYGVNEFDIANLEQAPSVAVRPPRVARAPAALEAKVTQIIPVEGTTSVMVLGLVVRVHVREGLLGPDLTVDPELLRPVGRLGRSEYATLGEVFSMARPDPVDV